MKKNINKNNKMPRFSTLNNMIKDALFDYDHENKTITIKESGTYIISFDESRIDLFCIQDKK